MRRTRACLTAAALLALTGLAPALARADVQPRDVVAIRADGSTVVLPPLEPGVSEDPMAFTGVYPTPPSVVATGGMYYWHVNTGGTLERLRVLAVVSGGLEETRLDYVSITTTEPGNRTVEHLSLGGHGWGSVRLLTEAAQVSARSLGTDTAAYVPGRFYGIASDGTLRRYARTYGDTPTVRSTGSQAGFSGVRTMALYSASPTRDILLMTTTSGALSALTVPTTGSSLHATSTRLRSSTWGSFDEIVMFPTPERTSVRLAAVDHDTATGYQYGVGVLRGTGTVVVGQGRWSVPASAPHHVGHPVLDDV